MSALDPRGASVPVGTVSVRTPGLIGRVRQVPPERKAAARNSMARSVLETALERQGFAPGPAIVLGARTGAPQKGRESRPAIEVDIPSLPPGYEQVLLQTDERGVITWVYPPAVESMRKGPVTARTFVVPVASYPRVTKGAGALVSKLIETFVFPRLAPVVGGLADRYAAAWEREHRPYAVRSFRPNEYTQPAPALDGAALAQLAAGPTLLFVHGTFARAHSAFASVPIGLMRELEARYGGRLIAFDHFTITDDPLINAQRFVDALPSTIRLELDVICHSRGGLVGRALSEQRGQLALGGRDVTVRRVVFAGSPNAGCVLADGKAMSHWIDRYTNWAAWLPTPGVVDVLEGALAVVKQLAVGVLGAMPGLTAMVPDGPYLAGLARGSAGTTRYFALASNYEPPNVALDSFAHDAFMDAIFQEDNDLVVPTRSVWDANGAPSFPVEARYVFRAKDAVDHGGYFAHPQGQAMLLSWLTPD